jgi:5-methylcytosine-specific restriction endonuclease McrA
VSHSAKYESRIGSRGWSLLRRAVLERNGGACERCEERFAREVHHTTYDRLGHEDLTDLEALCEPCHVLADRERVTRESGRLWDARLDGWARKVYGVDWDYHYDYHSVRESFERWLDTL